MLNEEHLCCILCYGKQSKQFNVNSKYTVITTLLVNEIARGDEKRKRMEANDPDKVAGISPPPGIPPPGYPPPRGS